MERQGAAMKFQYGNGESPLDGYVIRRGIGIGGFGEVYFAESDSGKEVALKRIQKNLDVEMRGVRHCLNLRHPNLVAIYDIRYDNDQQGWIVMEFIEGESLRDHLDRSIDTSLGPVHSYEYGSPQKVLPVFAQIVAGMTYLHDQGIVHRDLKPANIFLEKGLAKIGDYGLSKYISASRRAGQTESVGTFHYMAPEIGKGEYGKEIDIYSLGIILYEMLTGSVPFDGQSTQEILLKHLTADPDLSMLPDHLAEVIGKCLAKNPLARYRDGRELLGALGYELSVAGFVSPLAGIPRQPSGSPSTSQPKNRTADSGNEQAYYSDAYKLGHVKPLSPMERMNAFFSIGLDGHRRMLDREPIFQQLRSVYGSITQSLGLRSGKDSGHWILAMIAIAAMLSIGGIVVTGWAYAIGAYAIYYCLWFFGHVRESDLRELWPTPSAQRQSSPLPETYREAARPIGLQDTADYPTATLRSQASRPIRKPISSKEAKRLWKAQQQQVLGQRDIWNFSHTSLKALTFAGLVAAVTSVAGGYLAISAGPGSGFLSTGLGTWNSQALGAIAWLGAMSILCSWTVVTFARRWESRQEDSIAFRFAMMVAGLILGAISFQLSEFLLVPWSSVINPQADLHSRLIGKGIHLAFKGFYDENQMPNLAGHMAYFAGLMWIVRWWRQSDSLRKKKFSLWTVLWSMLLAGLVQAFFFFPSPWCLWMAGVVSLSVQIASPWIDPLEPQLAQNPLRGNHVRS